MRKSQELRNRADVKRKAGNAILATIDKENRDFSAQERTDIDAINTEIDTLLADAQRHERMENAELGRTRNAEVPNMGLDDPDEDEPKRNAKVFPLLGHQLQAIYTAATGKLVGGLNSVEEAHNKLKAAISGASEAYDSDGGHLVERDISTEIEAGMKAGGQILALCNAIEVQGNGLVEKYINETSRATGSRSGAIQTYWSGEGGDITTSKVKFDKRSTDLGKLVGAAYLTDELLADASALTGIYNEAFVDDLTFMTEDAIVEGDGNADKPLGILAHVATIDVTKATGQAAATFNNQNISDMWVRLFGASKAKAVWLINGELGPQIDQLSIPAGTGALEPRFVNYDAQGVLRIKGRPVIEVEYCSALGTSGDVILADFTGYRLIRKGGINQASSMHVRFLNDEMTFRITYRVGGQPKLKAKVTPFKGSLTRSYFVTLATRS